MSSEGLSAIFCLPSLWIECRVLQTSVRLKKYDQILLLYDCWWNVCNINLLAAVYFSKPSILTSRISKIVIISQKTQKIGTNGIDPGLLNMCAI